MPQEIPAVQESEKPTLEEKLHIFGLPRFFEELILKNLTPNEIQIIIDFELKFQNFYRLPAMEVEFRPQAIIGKHFVTEYGYIIPQNKQVMLEKLDVSPDAFELMSAFVHKRVDLLSRLSKKYKKREGSKLFRAVYEKFALQIPQILYLQSIVEQNRKVIREQEKRVKSAFDTIDLS